MPINSNRYVDITSSVGGLSAVKARELLLRVFVDTPYIPSNSFVEYDASELSEIDHVFGHKSLIYSVASFYFGFISKQTTSPRKIQFARWNRVADSAKYISYTTPNISACKALGSSVNFTVKSDDAENKFTLDFSSVSKATDITTEIQTKLKVKYSNLSASINKFGGITIDFGDKKAFSAIPSSSTAGTLLALGLDSTQNPTISSGNTAQSSNSIFECSASASNNFGSIVMLPTYDESTGKYTDITKDDIVSGGNWVNGRNVEFMLMVAVNKSNYSTIQQAVSGYASVALTLTGDMFDMSYILPSAVLASQDFSLPNASANYMYQTDARLIPSVFTDTDADTYDKQKINFYGRTQESGTMLDFYQRGTLQGGLNAPPTMGVHANEQWFKSTIKANFISMFLALGELPATTNGKAICISYLNDAVKTAKTNGTIVSGKSLDITQINYIKQLTNDPKAYLSIQTSGYWFDIKMIPEKNEMDYLLVYSKSDSINKIEGRHTLI